MVGPKVDTVFVVDSDLEVGFDFEGSTHDLDSQNLGHIPGHCCYTTDYVEAHTSGIHYPKTWGAGLGSSDQSSSAYFPSLGRGHSPSLFHYSACSGSSGPVTEMGCVRSPDVVLRNFDWAPDFGCTVGSHSQQAFAANSHCRLSAGCRC